MKIPRFGRSKFSEGITPDVSTGEIKDARTIDPMLLEPRSGLIVVRHANINGLAPDKRKETLLQTTVPAARAIGNFALDAAKTFENIDLLSTYTERTFWTAYCIAETLHKLRREEFPDLPVLNQHLDDPRGYAESMIWPANKFAQLRHNADSLVVMVGHEYTTEDLGLAYRLSNFNMAVAVHDDASEPQVVHPGNER